jgi:hypothetical protein
MLFCGAYMKLSLMLFCLVIISCVNKEPTYGYKEVEVDEIMENMDEPDWLLSRMARAGHMRDEDWLTQLNILKEESDKLVAIDHPDVFFQDEAERVAEIISDFINNLPAEKNQRALAWKKVKHSCEACHEIYE